MESTQSKADKSVVSIVKGERWEAKKVLQEGLGLIGGIGSVVKKGDTVIIKPNQIGTVTETCEAMLVAEENSIWRVVSHRSGEVIDPFLIHFAKAAGAEGVKIGVPVIKERISKFDELTRLYK